MIYELVLSQGTRIQLNLEYERVSAGLVRQFNFWHRVLSHQAFDSVGYLDHTLRDDTTRMWHFHNLDTAAQDEDLDHCRHSVQKISLAISRTCRQVYMEVIQLLFQKHTLVLQTDLVLRKLNEFLPRAHVNLIQSVELVWELPHFQQPHVSSQALRTYVDLWKCLGSDRLPALRRLRVIVNPRHTFISRGGSNKDFTEAWLGPVEACASSRRLEFLEFAIPQSYCEWFSKGTLDARTFRLRRMRDDLCHPSENEQSATSYEHQICPKAYQSFGPGESLHNAQCLGCS